METSKENDAFKTVLHMPSYSAVITISPLQKKKKKEKLDAFEPLLSLHYNKYIHISSYSIYLIITKKIFFFYKEISPKSI